MDLLCGILPQPQNQSQQAVEAGMTEIFRALADQAGLIAALTVPAFVFTLLIVLDRAGHRSDCEADDNP